MRFKQVFVLFMLFSSFFTIFFYGLTNPVKAFYLEGDYICDFRDIPQGTQDFIMEETGNGTHWLTVDGTSNNASLGVKNWGATYGDNYFLVDTWDLTSLNATFDIEVNSDYINFTMGSHHRLLGGKYDYKVWFNSTGGNNLWYLHWYELSSSQSYPQLKIYDYNDNLLYSFSGTATWLSFRSWYNSLTEIIQIEVWWSVGAGWSQMGSTVWYNCPVYSNVSRLDIYGSVTGVGIRLFVDEILITYDDDQNYTEHDFFVFIKPMRDMFYAGEYIFVYSNIPEHYDGQYYLTMQDSDSPRRKIFFYEYPQQGVYLPLEKGLNINKVFLPRKSPYGTDYVFGDWILAVADYDIFAPQQPYNNITTFGFNVSLGSGESIHNLKNTYILGNPITFNIYGKSNTNYIVILRDINNVLYDNATFKTDSDGFCSSGILSRNVSHYRLWLYNSSDYSYLNESDSFWVKNVSDINSYTSNCKNFYENNTLIEFKVYRLTGSATYVVDVLNPSGDLVYNSMYAADSGLVSFVHSTQIMGNGHFHLYIYTHGDSRKSGYHKVFEINSIEVTNINLIVGLGLSIGSGLGASVLTGSVYVFPFMTGIVAYSLTWFKIGDETLLPSEFGTYIIVILALMVLLLWLI